MLSPPQKRDCIFHWVPRSPDSEHPALLCNYSTQLRTDCRLPKIHICLHCLVKEVIPWPLKKREQLGAMSSPDINPLHIRQGTALIRLPGGCGKVFFPYGHQLVRSPSKACPLTMWFYRIHLEPCGPTVTWDRYQQSRAFVPSSVK